MCAVTEKVIFTDPYTHSDMNKYTPGLASYAQGIQNDLHLQLAVASLKEKFLGQTQALLHGDLHTGSVMASEGHTYVIDPEFAFYGPIGFDVGTFLAHLLMAYLATSATATTTTEGSNPYASFLLEQMKATHITYVQEFIGLWDKQATASGEGITSGELFKGHLWGGEGGLSAGGLGNLRRAQQQYFEAQWQDTLGFIGVEIIRRIVGVAHVADLESIADEPRRVVAEQRCLLLARDLMLSAHAGQGSAHAVQGSAHTVQGIDGLIEKAKAIYTHQPAVNWPQ